MASPQALSESDRRLVAAWAADCAERVLHLFEHESPADARPRDAIERTRAYARGELDAAGEIRRRFVAGRAATDVSSPAAIAAALALIHIYEPTRLLSISHAVFRLKKKYTVMR